VNRELEFRALEELRGPPVSVVSSPWTPWCEGFDLLARIDESTPDCLASISECGDELAGRNIYFACPRPQKACADTESAARTTGQGGAGRSLFLASQVSRSQTFLLVYVRGRAAPHFFAARAATPEPLNEQRRTDGASALCAGMAQPNAS